MYYYLLGKKNLQKIPHISAAAAAAKLLQSCLTLCDPVDGSPPGSSVPGILQAGILEWVAIFFSKACWVTSVVSDSVRHYGQQPTRPLCPWDPLGKNTGVGCHFHLQHVRGSMQFRSCCSKVSCIKQPILLVPKCLLIWFSHSRLLFPWTYIILGPGTQQRETAAISWSLLA